MRARVWGRSGGRAAGAAERVGASPELGSPTLVINTSDETEVLLAAEYSAFGEQRVLAGNPEVIPFGFAGGRYDAETGLVRFGARDYEPVTGRWTGKDPIRFEGGQGNIYVYVGNDPLNLVDVLGLSPCQDPMCFNRCMDGQFVGGAIMAGLGVTAGTLGSLPLLGKTAEEMAIAARLGAAESAAYSDSTSIISRAMSSPWVRNAIGTRNAVGIRNMFAFGSGARGGAAAFRTGVAGVTFATAYVGMSTLICMAECGG